MAFSILQDYTKKFDLFIASMDIQEMDCLSFIQTLKTLSDIPIVMVSRTMDQELASKALRYGVCQVINKSITREDARGLWQYVLRKRRIKVRNDVNNTEKDQLLRPDFVQPTVNSAGKSIETQKKIERNSQVEHINSDPNATITKNKKQNARSDDNIIKQNPEIQVIPPTGQQAIGMTNVASLNQATGHLQNATCSRTNFQTLGTIPLSQSTNTPEQNYFSVQNMPPTTNYGNSSFANYATSSGPGKEHALLSPNSNSMSYLPVNSAINLGQTVSQFGMSEGPSSMSKPSILSNTSNELAANQSTMLQGKIDLIRRVYETDNIFSGNSTFLPNTQTGTSEPLLLGANTIPSQFEQLSSEGVSDQGELVSKCATAAGGNTIPNYGYTQRSDSSNLGFASTQCGYVPSQALYATQVPFTSSAKNVQSTMQNSSNLQGDTMAKFQAASNLPPQAPYATQVLFTSSVNNVQTTMQNSNNLQADTMTRIQTSSNLPPQAPYATQVSFTSSANNNQTTMQNSNNLQGDTMAIFETSNNLPLQAPYASSANNAQSTMQNSYNLQADTMARIQTSSNLPPQAPYATQVSFTSSANNIQTIMQNSNNMQGDTMAIFQTSNNLPLQAPYASSANNVQSTMQNFNNLQGNTMERFQFSSNLPPQTPYAAQVSFTSLENNVQSTMQNSSSLQGDTTSRFQTSSNLPPQVPCATQVPFTSTINYVQSIMQNSSNLQGDTISGAQTSVYSSHGLSNSLMPAEGFTQQGVSPTNQFGVRNIEDIMVVDSSADILNNGGTSNSHSQQLNLSDMFLDEILAEFRSDFTANDPKNSGFNTRNSV